MKQLVVLSIILASVVAMNISVNEQPNGKEEALDHSGNLNQFQISNYTGSAITSEMVTVFKRAIDDAFTYYRDDIPENA